MVYVLLGTGFEEVKTIAPVDLMRRAGIEVQTVGITGKTVVGSHKIPVEADILPENMDLEAMDMIVLPGGLGGVASARASQAAPPCWQTWASPTGKRPPASLAARGRWGQPTWSRALPPPGTESSSPAPLPAAPFPSPWS